MEPAEKVTQLKQVSFWVDGMALGGWAVRWFGWNIFHSGIVDGGPKHLTFPNLHLTWNSEKGVFLCASG